MYKSKTKKALDEKQIISIVARHFDGAKPDRFLELGQGMYNSAYRIDVLSNSYVIKVAPPDNVKVLTYEKDILRAEVEFLTMLSKQSELIPKVIAYDYTRELIDRPYFIMEHIDGKPILNTKKFNTDEIYHKLGSLLNKLHQNEGKYYGYPYGKHYDSMQEFYISSVKDILKDLSAYKEILKKRQLDLILKSASAFDKVTSPKLVHFDVWEGNIFVNEKDGKYRFSGLIDWERAFYGDCLGDFISMKFLQDIRKNTAFLKGYYTDYKEFDNNELIRLSLLRIYLFLIMYTECFYRQINNSYIVNRIFSKFMLRKEIKKLRKLTN